MKTRKNKIKMVQNSKPSEKGRPNEIVGEDR